MGGGSKPAPAPSTVTQTSVSEPPAYVAAHGPEFMRRAAELSNVPYSTYEGERIAPLTPQHEAALTQGQEFLAGPDTGLAQQQAVARGDYLNANPYLDRMFGQAADAVTGRFADATALQGLTNSGAQQMLGRNLNDLATNIYGQNYAMERGAQDQAARGVGGLAQGLSQYGLGLGDVRRDVTQAGLNEQLRQFEEQRLYPYQQLDVLGRAIGMGMGTGGTVTSTGPGYYQPSGTANMLGGGLLGYGLGQQMGNPYLGAGLGALGGYFA